MYTRSASSSRSRAASEVSLGLADPSHGHPPAIAVLRQPGVLAQLLGLRSSCLAQPRSLRSRWSALIPTYMSAVPRSDWPVLARQRPAGPARRCASRRASRPWVTRMSARVIEHPSTSEMCPARSHVSPCTRRTPRGLSRGRRSPRTRARSAPWPLRARRGRPPRRGPAPAGRGPRCRAVARAPAPARHGGRRCQAGSRRNSASSRDDHPARRLGSRTWCSGSSSQRSASRRCRSTPSMVPVDSSAAT